MLHDKGQGSGAHPTGYRRLAIASRSRSTETMMGDGMIPASIMKETLEHDGSRGKFTTQPLHRRLLVPMRVSINTLSSSKAFPRIVTVDNGVAGNQAFIAMARWELTQTDHHWRQRFYRCIRRSFIREHPDADYPFPLPSRM